MKIKLLLFLFSSPLLVNATDTLIAKTVIDTIAIDHYNRYQIDPNSKQKNGYYLTVYKGKTITKGYYKNDMRNGEWEFIGINDTLQLKGIYNNGNMEGKWTSFYSNGAPSCIMPFKNGKKNGLFQGFYSNGTVSFETPYINDGISGISIYYYSNAKISYTETYVNDELNGLAKKYYDNGVLKEEKFMKDGKRDSIYKFYYDSGTLWEHLIYKNGNEYNVIAYNSPDGKPLNCCTLKDGNGIMRFYNKEGKIESERSIKNSKLNGNYKDYKNGILVEEGNYIEGKAEGEWIEYFETKELYSKKNYKNNEEDGKVIYYFKNGKISQEGEYNNGKRSGLWISYTDIGDILSEINYKDGKYDGEAKFYDKGIINNSGNYSNGVKIGYWNFYNRKGKSPSKIDFGNPTATNSVEAKILTDIPHKETSDKPLTIAEQMPVFPGGERVMMEFIQKNIIFPNYAKENGIHGTVYITFVVGHTGEIREAKIIRSVQRNLDDEALRIINIMPRWTAGMQNGRPVSVQFNLPIKYILK